ncbi:MAG: N-acetylmuramic acid 6-phosphate etherase [Bacteroidota bacterium]
MKITESASKYNDLEKMSVKEMLTNINQEDYLVAKAVQKTIPQLEKVVSEVSKRLKEGGRLFYIGAGTSGRLGILDASECPPTFGVPHDLVVGLIAGGDRAIRKAVEFAEDDTDMAWVDLKRYKIDQRDCLIGIAASGTTPYVIGGIKQARANGIFTSCITCNPGSPVAEACEIPIEVFVGPEFVTGSTRMKSGTAQKMVLNMISTSVMIQLGRVKGNRMVDMQLSNNKLVKRGIEMLTDEFRISEKEAEELLNKYGSVREVINQRYKNRA